MDREAKLMEPGVIVLHNSRFRKIALAEKSRFTRRLLKIDEFFQRILYRISREFAIFVNLACGECLVFSEKTGVFDPTFCRSAFEGHALSPSSSRIPSSNFLYLKFQ